MTTLDLTLPDLEENLALDEALLLEAEEGRGGEILRFWEWPEYAVVLGAGGQMNLDVNEAACRTDGVPIARRASGGGTVLLGRGSLVFTLVLSYSRAKELRDLSSSYRWIMSKLAQALQPIGHVEHVGICDLAVAGRKISGNAQQRKREFLLHHGTILYDFDLPRIETYLHLPKRQPDYRAGRSHGEFVTNLDSTSANIRELLRGAWEIEGDALDWPGERTAALVSEKYRSPEWVHRL